MAYREDLDRLRERVFEETARLWARWAALPPLVRVLLEPEEPRVLLDGAAPLEVDERLPRDELVERLMTLDELSAAIDRTVGRARALGREPRPPDALDGEPELAEEHWQRRAKADIVRAFEEAGVSGAVERWDRRTFVVQSSADGIRAAYSARARPDPWVDNWTTGFEMRWAHGLALAVPVSFPELVVARWRGGLWDRVPGASRPETGYSPFDTYFVCAGEEYALRVLLEPRLLRRLAALESASPILRIRDGNATLDWQDTPLDAQLLRAFFDIGRRSRVA